VKPQGTRMGMQVKEFGESECRFVMRRIQVEILPDLKEGRLPKGV